MDIPIRYRLKTAYRYIRLVALLGAISPFVTVSLVFQYLAKLIGGKVSLMA
jgi:hypothetical protein